MIRTQKYGTLEYLTADGIAVPHATLRNASGCVLSNDMRERSLRARARSHSMRCMDSALSSLFAAIAQRGSKPGISKYPRSNTRENEQAARAWASVSDPVAANARETSRATAAATRSAS